MPSSSTPWTSAHHLDHLAAPSMSGHSANQDSKLRRLEPDNHEQQKWRQMAGQGVSNSVPGSVPDSESDSDVSLQEHNAAPEATNLPEDLERIRREYEEQVNETYRQVTQRVKNSGQNPQHTNEDSISAGRSSHAKQTGPQSGTDKRQRKRPRQEHDDTRYTEPERPSSFLASVRAWRKGEEDDIDYATE